MPQRWLLSPRSLNLLVFCRHPKHISECLEAKGRSPTKAWCLALLVPWEGPLVRDVCSWAATGPGHTQPAQRFGPKGCCGVWGPWSCLQARGNSVSKQSGSRYGEQRTPSWRGGFGHGLQWAALNMLALRGGARLKHLPV